jgi:sigma-B regulation protein RsbU (phosphoserine phosphatase)
MRVLVADDDSNLRRLLQRLLIQWGFEVELAEDGKQAYQALVAEDGPKLAILDWDMPEITGPEICRLCREQENTERTYLIILTGKETKADVVDALDAGADDFVVKPFDCPELKARLHVGVRMVKLQESLALRVRQLQESLSHIKVLKRLIPICAYCKKIRDDNDYWQQVDQYMMSQADIKFSHGICPDCFEKLVAKK